MRRMLIASLFAFAAAATAENSADVQTARQQSMQLGAELKSALLAAIQKSPIEAIAVCNERAPAIAARLSADNRATIGRTALKVRNPKNEPTEWQRAVLLDFKNRVAAGESIANIEYFSSVEKNGTVEQRYMKAIGTEPLCVTCHGKQVDASLLRVIKEKYPQDQATGFDVGELRGAIYVVRTLAKDRK